MVATRSHPTEFVAPATETAAKSSPTKRPTRTSAAPSTTASDTIYAVPSASTTRTAYVRPSTSTAPSMPSQPFVRPQITSYTAPSRRTTTWTHTPSNLTLTWLAISLPLVIWDTGYVLLRPHSMPGGSLQWPLWMPYELYGQVDHVYGWKSWDAHNGWTAAQGTFNVFETVAYGVYLYWVYTYGKQEKVQGRGAPDVGTLGRLKALGESRTVHGKIATWAVLVAFSTASLTFFKTVLYWLVEAYSGFDNIGHNDVMSLIFLWIIPNGAWLVLPLYMMYVFGAEILQGLETAAEGGRKVR
ncbi:hypothetical protein LTR62_006311 [Meristemomyces frigidus]|uniref:Uncharacterized protein n=1 Tax=Meristemomyces frigidus TaxID=1508187 RepID=A0AAN7TBW7_9PEZI|nr:hypothetical protein LTR62_006311 [Meristemomyces frigidus]